MSKNITNQSAKLNDKNNDILYKENTGGFQLHQRQTIVACAHMSPKFPRKSGIPQFVRNHDTVKMKAAKLQNHDETKNTELIKAAKSIPKAQNHEESKCQRSRSCGGHNASFTVQNSSKNVKHSKGKGADARNDSAKPNNREGKVTKISVVVPKILYKAPLTTVPGYRCCSAGNQANRPAAEKRIASDSKHNLKSTSCDMSTKQRMHSVDSSNTYRESSNQANEEFNQPSPPLTTFEPRDDTSDGKRNLEAHSSPSFLKTKLCMELKVLYDEKKKRLEMMQSELIDKQKVAKELHNSLQEMRDKIRLASVHKSSTNKTDDAVGGINIVDAKKVIDKSQEGNRERLTNEKELENFSTTIAEKLYEIPASVQTLCEQALCKRHQILKWLQSLLCKSGKTIKSEDFANQLNELMAESDELAVSYNEAMTNLYRGIRNTLDLLQKSNFDREHVKERTESLSLEIAELRNMNDALQQHFVVSTGDRSTLIRADNAKIEELERDLAAEMNRREMMKDQLQDAEKQLNAKQEELKQSMLKLEKSEIEKATLTKTIKDMEDENKTIKTEYEEQMEVVTDSLNMNLEKIDKINAHVSDLEQIVSTQRLQLSSLSETVTRLEEENCDMRKKCEYYEKKVSNMDGLIHDLEMQIQQLLEKLEKQADSKEEMKSELIKNTELLKSLQKQNEAYKREKQKLMDKRFSERGVETDINAVESEKWISYGEILVEKDKKVKHYEEQLKELKNAISQLATTDGECKSNSFPELKDVVINQRTKLIEITQHNSKLASDLVEKNKLIEKYEKSLSEQSSLLQMKDEVIQMLSSKDVEQSSAIQFLHQNIEIKEKFETELKRKIKENAEEIEKLNSDLKTRKIQTDHLERLVLALENQHNQNRLKRQKDKERITDLERLVGEALKQKSSSDLPLDLDKLLTLIEFHLGNDEIDTKGGAEEPKSLIDEPPVLERKQSIKNTKVAQGSRNKVFIKDLLTASNAKYLACSSESMNYASNHSYRLSENSRRYSYNDQYRTNLGTNFLEKVNAFQDKNRTLGLAESVKTKFMSRPR